MSEVYLKVDGVKELERKFKNFHIKNPTAIKLAMNHSASKAQTASLRKVRKNWNIRARDLKRHVAVEKATVSKSIYVFKFKSRAISLFEFHAEQRDKGVSYKIQKKRKILEGSFLNGGSRQPFVLKRKGKARYPILPYFSVTPSYMFLKEKAKEEYISVFKSGFRTRYIHELNRLLK